MSERWFWCKQCNDLFRSPDKHQHEHTADCLIEHPTQKPHDLTERLLKAAKPEENGVVLIPFAGTGSECAVAQELDMEFHAFDINPEYVLMANIFLDKVKLPICIKKALENLADRILGLCQGLPFAQKHKYLILTSIKRRKIVLASLKLAITELNPDMNDHTGTKQLEAIKDAENNVEKYFDATIERINYTLSQSSSISSTV